MSKPTTKRHLKQNEKLINYLNNYDFEKEFQSNYNNLPINSSDIQSISQNTKKTFNSLHSYSLWDKTSMAIGKIPWWIKLPAGGVFIGVTLLGLTTNVMPLAALGIAGATGYYIAYYMLADQYKNIKIRRSDINAVASNFAATLEVTCTFLTKNIAWLAKENAELQKNIQELKNSIGKLESIEGQLSHTNQALSLKISQLEDLKNQSATEIDELKKVNTVLKGTVETLSEGLLANQDDRKKFIAKLKNFANRTKTEFHSIAQRICKSETALRQVRFQLAQCNEQYHSLLKTHSKLIDKQEKQIESFKEATLARASDSGNARLFTPVINSQLEEPQSSDSVLRPEPF